MADITRLPFLLRHLRGGPTSYVRHLRRGAVAHEGIGTAFWFVPLTAAISEVPVDDRELPLLFHARTADFQDVTVQATVTYRITEPALAAQRVDFSIDSAGGAWRGDPLDQVAALLTETVQQHALDMLAGATLTDALVGGLTAVRDRVTDGVAGDQRLAETGLAVLGVRVVAIRPESDVERALQTPTRERMQTDADRATYERRALAVERERAISENELQSKIELARREEQLVAQRGTNARLRAQEEAAAGQIAADAQAARDIALAEAKATATRLIGAAEGSAESARLAAYAGTDPAVLLALAARELAGNLPEIGSLVLTPDLLAPVLAKLGAVADRP